MPSNENPDTYGWVFLGLAVAAALVTLKLAREGRWILASQAFAAFCIPTAIVPQLINNINASSDMVAFINPFFLAMYPLSVVFEMPSQLSVIARAHTYEYECNAFITMAGMVVRLILYTVWLSQYGYYGHYTEWTIFLAVFVAVSTLASLIAATYIKSSHKKDEPLFNGILF